MKRLYLCLPVLLAFIVVPRPAMAIPTYLTEFNAFYGTSGTPLGSCLVCHISASGAGGMRNPYGDSFAIAHTGSISASAALKAIEPLDSDGDTFTNIAEIKARTFPGNSKSFPLAHGSLPGPGSNLLNTTWVGDLTVVAVDGTVTTITGTTLTFHTRNNESLSGAISEPAIAFSGMISDDDSIQMAAVNYLISARFSGSHSEHERGNDSTSQMRIKGKNFADGSLFFGTLTRQ
jgi:hypothetical protein